MIQLRFIFILVILFVVNGLNAQTSSGNRGFEVNVGEQVHNFPLYMMNGDTILMSDLEGKVVVLQFTASWCSVCRKEMPHLQNEVWEPNKNKDFILIGVDIDEDVNKVSPFIEQMQVTYPIAIDNNKEIFYNFAAKGAGVTRNIVIDKTGEIVFLTRLFDPVEFEQMKSKIESLLSN